MRASAGVDGVRRHAAMQVRDECPAPRLRDHLRVAGDVAPLHHDTVEPRQLARINCGIARSW
jgi:hypothetical protein